MKRIGLLTALLLLLGWGAQAQVFVKPTASGAGDGTSWANAYGNADLQTAIDEAAAGSKLVIMAGGTYYTQDNDGFEISTGVVITGGYTANLMDPLERDMTGNPTIVSADVGTIGDITDNHKHVFRVLTGQTDVFVDGVVINDAYFNSGNGSNNQNKGAFLVDGGSATISSCSFYNNYKHSGGAVGNVDGTLTITKSVFHKNSSGTAWSNQAGAIYNENATTTIDSCLFDDNETQNEGSHIYSLGSTVSLNHCTIKNTSKTNSSMAAGMYNENCMVYLYGVTMQDMTCKEKGAGMYNLNSAVYIDSCTFKNLEITDSNADGGAIHNSGGYDNGDGTFTYGYIQKSTFTGNKNKAGNGADEGSNGAAVYNETSGMRIENCTFDANHGIEDPSNTGYSGVSGAAIGNKDCVDLNIFGCTFTNNTSRGNAGAIWNYNSTGNIDSCTFVANESQRNGGAIANHSNSQFNIDNCLFKENHIHSGSHNGGGAIFNDASQCSIGFCRFIDNIAEHDHGSHGTAIWEVNQSNSYMSNCLFVGNTQTGGDGGTVALGDRQVDGTGSSMSMAFCTFAENYAAYGGAMRIAGGSSPVISSCIFWNNKSLEGSRGDEFAIYHSATDDSEPQITNCIVKDQDIKEMDGEWAWGTANYATSNNLDADPVFVDPDTIDATDGNEFWLGVGSAAIDAGDDAIATLVGATSDLAGNPRTDGDHVDMGAYERDLTPPAGYSISFDQTSVSADNQDAISFTFTDAEPTASYTYSITSDGGAGEVTGGGTITATDEQITGIDLSTLADGTITASVTLTDVSGNKGAAASDDIAKDSNGPSVEITLADGQTSSTGSSPINFKAVFSESVDDFADVDVTVGGTANATTAEVTGSGTTYNVAVSGMTGDGTVNITLAEGVATDAAGNPSAASTNTANEVSYDGTAPSGYTVDIDQTTITTSNEASLSFTFADAEVDATYDYTIASDGGGTDVTGTGTITAVDEQIMDIDVSGLEDGTLTLTVTLEDATGNTGSDATATVSKDTEVPSGYTVDFDQENISSNNEDAISFTFSSAEVDATYDYTIMSDGGGTDVTGSGTITAADEQITAIDVSGLEDGTLTLTVTLEDAAGNTGSDATATVTKDTEGPSGHDVMIDQDVINAANATTMSFTFSDAEVDATYDYTIASDGGGTDVTGTGTITAAEEQITAIDVSGLEDGTLTLSVVLEDALGNASQAVTVTVSKDTEAPSVSIEQADGQADPTSALPVEFTVTLTEEVKDLTAEDLTWSGTATGVVAAISGSGTEYTISVTSVDVGGTLQPDIEANAIEDLAGNPNEASTSTDNEVTYDPTSIAELSALNITAYPNPVSDLLTIQSPNTGWTATITDVQGRQVLAQRLNSQNTTLDVSHLPAGLYILQISNGQQQAQQKLMIQ